MANYFVLFLLQYYGYAFNVANPHLEHFKNKKHIFLNRDCFTFPILTNIKNINFNNFLWVNYVVLFLLQYHGSAFSVANPHLEHFKNKEQTWSLEVDVIYINIKT